MGETKIVKLEYSGCECPLCMIRWVLDYASDRGFAACDVALALGEELGGIIAIAPSPQAADHAMSLFTDAFNAASASEGSRAGEAATITTRAANRRPI